MQDANKNDSDEDNGSPMLSPRRGNSIEITAYGAINNASNVIARSDRYQNELNIITIPPNEKLSRFTAFWQIATKCITIAASFTFGFEVVLIITMLNYLSENEDETASIALISTLMNTVVTLGVSVLFAMSVFASKYLGEIRTLEMDLLETNEEQRGEVIMLEAASLEINEAQSNEQSIQEKRNLLVNVHKNGLMISAFVVPPMMITLIFSEAMLTNMFDQDREVARYAQQFLRPYALAIPGLAFRVCAEQMMFSFNRVMPAMLMGLSSLGVGTALSLYLGFVKKLGTSGIAVGYIVEAYLTALSYGLYIGRHHDLRNYNFYRLFTNMQGNLKEFFKLVKLGSFYLIAVSNEALITFLTSIFAGIIGTLEQEAWVFALQYIYLLFLVSSAFGMGCCQEISREIGAECYENASRIGKYGLLATLVFIVPLPIVFAVEPSILMNMLGNHQENIYDILVSMIPIVSVGVISDSIRYNLLQQLRPLKREILATVLSVVGLTLGIVLAGVLGFATSLGVNGIAIGYTVGSMLAAISLFICWMGRISPANIAAMQAATQPNIVELNVINRAIIIDESQQPINIPVYLPSGNTAPMTSTNDCSRWLIWRRPVQERPYQHGSNALTLR